MEFWYDRHHTGALRILDWNRHLIIGSDPQKPYWTAPFTLGAGNDNKRKKSILVQFSSKNTHRGTSLMSAVYRERRNELEWEDGNVWYRIRADPTELIKRL